MFDHDSKFSGDVEAFLKDSGLKAVRTGIRSPWQNGVAERWVESIRREMLDHVIPLNAAHLFRLSQEYIRYYHEDRTHIALNKDTTTAREVEPRPLTSSRVLSVPRIGGLPSPVLVVGGVAGSSAAFFPARSGIAIADHEAGPAFAGAVQTILGRGDDSGPFRRCET